MNATSLRARLPEPAALTVLCLATAATIHLVVPPGDAAAHLYRTFLVRHGVWLWDNLWFAGQYPIAGYSLLYYFPAALLGNVPLAFVAAVASTLLFASLAREEWAHDARWPVRIFAVLAAAPLFTGLFSYSLGSAFMFGALRALRSNRVRTGLGLAALTLGCSPLAFIFLVLILAAFTIGRRHDRRRVAAVVGGLSAIAAVQVAALVVFPSRAIYPFHGIALFAVLGVSVVGALLGLRARGGRPFVALFLLWALGAVFCYVVPTPLGDNWTRLSAFLLPVMLITAIRAEFRPRLLAAVALAGALAYNVTPYLLLIPYRLDQRPAKIAFWQPALTFVRAHLLPGARVEVVPTAAHWESYWVPHAGIPLARGFYDQIDAADDAVVYRPRVGAHPYSRWLHQLAVAYVLLPHTKLDRAGGQGEANLLESGATGMRVVLRDRDWTIYAVRQPTPIVSKPARVEYLGHRAIVGWAERPGRYLLRVRYTPLLGLVTPGCVGRGPASMTSLTVTRAGRFVIDAQESPEAALDKAVAGRPC